MTEKYIDEPIIGHHVSATREKREPPEYLQNAADRLDIELRSRPDFVRIEEGDVDWDESKEVKVTVDQLREMALHHTDLEEQ